MPTRWRGDHLQIFVHVEAPQRFEGLSAAALKGPRKWLGEWPEAHGLVPFREQAGKLEPEGSE
jgi:hypothetical protein